MASPTLVIRSKRLRIVAVIGAVVTFAALMPWEPLSGGMAGDGVYFPEDRWALAGSAVVLGALWLLLLLVKVEADVERVRVRGVLRDVTLPWTAVEAVRYSRGTPWASLVLTNGEPIAMLALTRFDGQRAVDDIRRLRALHRDTTPQASGAIAATGATEATPAAP